MNQYQARVSNTQKYEDRQGSHIVHEGELLFLTEQSPHWVIGDLYREVGTNRIFRGNTTNRGIQKNSTFESIKPIIISETEEIEEGDKILFNGNTQIPQGGDYTEADNVMPYKVLALPEHFSDKHLQAIVDGKMKEGDTVYLKVKEIKSPHHNYDGGTEYLHEYFQVALDQQNHITLFPAKQTIREAALEHWNMFKSDIPDQKRMTIKPAFTGSFIAGAEWAKKNNF